MIEIKKENVHRVVDEHAFDNYWKQKGFVKVGKSQDVPQTEQPKQEIVDDESELDIEALKVEATELGISFMPNIGYDKLKRRIEEHKANN